MWSTEDGPFPAPRFGERYGLSRNRFEILLRCITRNFGRSLRIPDASLQTSVNFPRTRPLTCMEQSAFLFSINQESTEKRKAVKNIVKPEHLSLCVIDETKKFRVYL